MRCLKLKRSLLCELIDEERDVDDEARELLFASLLPINDEVKSESEQLEP